MLSARRRRNKASGLAIFDGDDTLWATQVLYDRAKERFVGLLESLSLDASEILDLLDDIDAHNVETAGYAKSRFRDSMINTYRVLCSRHRSQPTTERVEAIARIAEEVFEQSPVIYPDTIKCLCTLRVFYKLALVTKGDPEIQRRRVEQTRMGRLFDRVYYVPEKGESEYLRVLAEFGVAPVRTWVIGNSARFDMNPGLRLGLRCIFILRNTWRYERAELERGDVTMVNSLAEAVSTIAARDGLRLLETRYGY